MRVKIIPHGTLCETWPEAFECEATTPRQALHALDSQFDLRPSRELHVFIEIVGMSSPAAFDSPLVVTELHCVPSFSGAGGGGGGIIQIVVGAIIVIASILLLQPEGVYAGVGLASATAFSVGLGIGTSLILGGLLELISPAPKLNNPKQTPDSLYLGVPGNTTQIGTPIPIGYGTFAVYGQYLSYNIQTSPLSITTNSNSSASASGVSLVSNIDGQTIITLIP